MKGKITLKELIKYVCILVGFTLFLVLVSLDIKYHKQSHYQDPCDYNYEIYRGNLDLKYYKTKDSLVTNINKYIQKMSNGKSCLDGLNLLNACDEYNIDLKFVLVQGQLESSFGSLGIAAKTNSVFNVHSYDNKSARDIINEGKGYSHPNQSVRPYLNLLRKRYLVDGKTEMDMFDNFVDKDGKRYASAENYEQSLMSAYNNIDNVVPITDIYRDYLKYKIMLGR